MFAQLKMAWQAYVNSLQHPKMFNFNDKAKSVEKQGRKATGHYDSRLLMMW